MQETISKKGKQIAIISYMTFIGLFIAYFMNRDERSAFATHHIKMMFGWVLLLFISQISGFHIDPLLGTILYFVALGLWIASLISAIQEKRINIPFLSEKFQEWFRFLD